MMVSQALFTFDELIVLRHAIWMFWKIFLNCIFLMVWSYTDNLGRKILHMHSYSFLTLCPGEYHPNELNHCWCWAQSLRQCFTGLVAWKLLICLVHHEYIFWREVTVNASGKKHTSVPEGELATSFIQSPLTWKTS